MATGNTPRELSRRAVANIRRLRKLRKWSAQDLANRMAADGFPISRSVISNRECQEPPSPLTVDELFAFAAVFERTVMDLVEGEITCDKCDDSPPAGFRCLSCGAAAPEDDR